MSESAWVAHVQHCRTPLTANCLLGPCPDVEPNAAVVASVPPGGEARVSGGGVEWISGFYKLRAATRALSAETEGNEEKRGAEASADVAARSPLYLGGCGWYRLPLPEAKAAADCTAAPLFAAFQWLTAAARGSAAFPGVFDMQWLPVQHFDAWASPSLFPAVARDEGARAGEEPLHAGSEEAEGRRTTTVPPRTRRAPLLMACTDGSVRVLVLSKAAAEAGVRVEATFCFPALSATMLTSCTPLLLPAPSCADGETASTPLFVCTAHTGNCFVLQPTSGDGCGEEAAGGGVEPPTADEREAERSAPLGVEADHVLRGGVTALESHAYDAWSSAAFTIPVESADETEEEEEEEGPSCSFRPVRISAASPSPCVAAGKEDAEGGRTPRRGHAVETVHLATGGDDGVVKFYQLLSSTPPPDPLRTRHGKSALSWECRGEYSLEAGAVSIAPVRRLGDSSMYRWPLQQWMRASTSEAGCAPSDSSAPGSGGEEPLSAVWRADTQATPYVLVGSYDESLTLLDVRRLPTRRGGGAALRRRLAQAVVAERTRLGGGVWRAQRTLFPVAEERPAGDAGSVRRPLPAISPGWVSDRNVLLLPLMQGGAGLLAYDVLAPASEVFHQESVMELERQGPEALAVEERLVYDIAALSPQWYHHEDAATTTSGLRPATEVVFQVATTSFYERRVDLFRLGPFSVVGDSLQSVWERVRGSAAEDRLSAA